MNIVGKVISADAGKFDFEVTSRSVGKNNYVFVNISGYRTLSQVGKIFTNPEQQTIGKCKIIGYKDMENILQRPNVPASIGTMVYIASSQDIKDLLQISAKGAYIGLLKNTNCRVCLDTTSILNKHICILAKTGSGKSYTTAVLIEEFMKRNIPLVVIDPHGEYNSLMQPNIFEKPDLLYKFRVKPKSYATKIVEYSVNYLKGTRHLSLDDRGLTIREMDKLFEKPLTPTQQALIYRTLENIGIKNYKLDHIKKYLKAMKKKPSTVFSVLVSIDQLQNTKVFEGKTTQPYELVRRGQCTVINLKGIEPRIKEIVVSLLATQLFKRRMEGKIPPFLFVIEEAHIFAPKMTTAISSKPLKTVASEGRKFNMGIAVISQRPTDVSNNILSQCNTQIILKMTNLNDIENVLKSIEGISQSSADDIQALSIGQALVSNIKLTMPIIVEIRCRETQDAGVK